MRWHLLWLSIAHSRVLLFLHCAKLKILQLKNSTLICSREMGGGLVERFNTMKLNLINYVASREVYSLVCAVNLCQSSITCEKKLPLQIYCHNYSSLHIYNRHSLFGSFSFHSTHPFGASLQHVNHREKFFGGREICFPAFCMGKIYDA
jgi:hypothetical protein